MPLTLIHHFLRIVMNTPIFCSFTVHMPKKLVVMLPAPYPIPIIEKKYFDTNFDAQMRV